MSVERFTRDEVWEMIRTGRFDDTLDFAVANLKRRQTSALKRKAAALGVGQRVRFNDKTRLAGEVAVVVSVGRTGKARVAVAVPEGSPSWEFPKEYNVHPDALEAVKATAAERRADEAVLKQVREVDEMVRRERAEGGSF